MKRKYLEDLGLEKDVIDKIMEENGKDIEAAKGELEKITKERDDLKNTVSNRDKQLDELKKSVGSAEDLKKTIEQLQKDNQAIKVDAAIEKALTGAKAKNLTAVKALLKDLDKAELLDDGTIKGLDAQIKTLRSADDSKFLFEEEKKSKPNIRGAIPGEPGDGKPTPITKKEFDKMSYKERLNLYNTDKETYEALAGTAGE